MTIVDPSIRHRYLNPAELLTFPAKVNIHFPMRGRLFHHCVALNERIDTLARSEVTFQADSFQIPHVTLYMGFAENFANLRGVLKETAAFAADLPRLALSVSRPYLKEPRKTWVFCDVAPVDHILGLKVKLRDRLARYLVPLSWDIVAETPHLTLGYVKAGDVGVVELLGKCDGDVTGEADAVEVSFGGARGTCLGSIRTYELGPP